MGGSELVYVRRTGRSVILNPDILKLIGVGVDYPWSFNRKGSVKGTTTTQGLDKINDAIYAILSTYPGERVMLPEFGCVTGDTKIPLLNGAEVEIKDLVGRPAWLYGITPEGRIKEVKSDGAVYQGKKKIMRVILDNDEKIDCTLDHRFIMRNGAECQAQFLCVGDSLIPLRRTVDKRGNKWHSVPVPNNHKVKALLFLEGCQDVYDLVNTETENFGISAGVFIHNSQLPSLVFNPLDFSLFQSLRLYTVEALQRWEKRITVKEVLVGNDPTTYDQNTVHIAITYQVIRTHVEGVFTYPFISMAYQI